MTTNIPPTRWFPSNIKALNDRFEAESPQALLRWANTNLGQDLALSTGFGLSGIVLMHMLSEIRPHQIRIFYLETDLHFNDTHHLRDQLQGRLGLSIEEVHSGLSLGDQAKRFGPDLWQSEPGLCCHLRKVEPLRRYLADKRGWITGIRRDQGGGRATTPVVSWDDTNQLVKLAPLATWPRDRVLGYIKKHQLPTNKLHDEGYASIGCWPCTAKTAAGGGERSGRWAGTQKTECGIHTSQLTKLKTA